MQLESIGSHDTKPSKSPDSLFCRRCASHLNLSRVSLQKTFFIVFAPTRHCRLIGRIFMLKINPYGKILPVRIFKPFIKNGFVTHATRVFMPLVYFRSCNASIRRTGQEGRPLSAQKLADKLSSKLCQSIASASFTIAWCGETISRNKGLNKSPCCSLRVSLFVIILQTFFRFCMSSLQ